MVLKLGTKQTKKNCYKYLFESTKDIGIFVFRVFWRRNARYRAVVFVEQYEYVLLAFL